MGVCRIQKRDLVCIDGSIFAAKITPIAFRVYYLFADKERHSEWFSLSKKDLSLIDSTLKRMGGIREPN